MKSYRNNKTQARCRGFTLIEIIIVVAIIAIISTMGWSMYLEQSRKSQRSEAIALASMLRLEMERCASNNNGVYVAGCTGIAMGVVLPVILAKYDPSGARGNYYNTAIAITGGGAGYNINITDPIGNDLDCTSFTLNNFGQKGFTQAAGRQSNLTRCWGSN